MRNAFKKIGDRIRGSGFIIPIGWLLILACGATLVTSLSDFYTSYRGVGDLPIQPADPGNEFELALRWLYVICVALIPQLVTVIGSFAGLALLPENTEEQWIRRAAISFALVAVLIDVFTGYYYYIKPEYASFIPLLDWGDAAVREAQISALVMSAGVDTLFSEVGFTVAWGLTFEVWHDWLLQWRRVLNQLNELQKKPQDNNRDSAQRPEQRQPQNQQHGRQGAPTIPAQEYLQQHRGDNNGERN